MRKESNDSLTIGVLWWEWGMGWMKINASKQSEKTQKIRIVSALLQLGLL